MFIQRLAKNIASQNWSTLLIEFVLVILGVFLAFQADQWYEQTLFESNEQSYLLALAGDFGAVITELERAEARITTAVDAAKKFVGYDLADAPQMSHEEFYRTLSRASRLTSILFVSRSYDSLIASGNIEAIGDQSLRAELAAFYARIEGQDLGSLARQYGFQQNQFHPYLIRTLDQASYMIFAHPEEAKGVSPAKPLDQHLDVLGTPDFKSMLATKWHMNFDLRMEVRSALVQARKIEELITVNLGEDVADAEAIRVRD